MEDFDLCVPGAPHEVQQPLQPKMHGRAESRANLRLHNVTSDRCEGREWSIVLSPANIIYYKFDCCSLAEVCEKHSIFYLICVNLLIVKTKKLSQFFKLQII